MDLIEWASRRLPPDDLAPARFEVSTLDVIRRQVARSRKLGRRLGRSAKTPEQLPARRVE